MPSINETIERVYYNVTGLSSDTHAHEAEEIARQVVEVIDVLREQHREEFLADLLDWEDAEIAKVTYTDGWSHFPDLVQAQLNRKEDQRLGLDPA